MSESQPSYSWSASPWVWQNIPAVTTIIKSQQGCGYRTLRSAVKLGTVDNCRYGGQPTSGLGWAPGRCQWVRWVNMWQALMQLLYTKPVGMWGQTVSEDFSSSLPIWFLFLSLHEWKTNNAAEGGGKQSKMRILSSSSLSSLSLLQTFDWPKKTLKSYSLEIATSETVNCFDVV